MRDYATETERRIGFIRGIVKASGADGIVFANSGGKDAVLTGILCKKACDDTVGLILPCGSRRNYESDKTDALAISEQFGISARVIDLAGVKEEFLKAIGAAVRISDMASANLSARLRMCTLNAISNSENRLVAGTGNRSERYMGYFTKWGDGAYDFNPIADLLVTEVYEFLRYFGVPARIIEKAPSAGLYEGQTDEAEMGVTYRSIDDFLLYGETDGRDMEIIKRYHDRSEHKRNLPINYPG